MNPFTLAQHDRETLQFMSGNWMEILHLINIFRYIFLFLFHFLIFGVSGHHCLHCIIIIHLMTILHLFSAEVVSIAHLHGCVWHVI